MRLHLSAAGSRNLDANRVIGDRCSPLQGVRLDARTEWGTIAVQLLHG
jgi:hypothetical protein